MTPSTIEVALLVICFSSISGLLRSSPVSPEANSFWHFFRRLFPRIYENGNRVAFSGFSQNQCLGGV